MRDGIVGADAVEGDGEGIGKRLRRGHADAQAGKGARAHARHDGIEVAELQTGLAHHLEDGGHEPFIMRARIGQNALRQLPRLGVDYPGDQGGRRRIDGQDAH